MLYNFLDLTFMVKNLLLTVTDHRPLVALFSQKKSSSKSTRICVELSDYNFEKVYKKEVITQTQTHY